MSSKLTSFNLNYNLKNKNVKKIEKHYEIYDTKRGDKKVRIFIYKGEPIGSKELTETDKLNKLRLVRLNVDFLKFSHKMTDVQKIIYTETIKNIDIDLSLLEGFFKLYLKRSVIVRFFNKLIEIYDSNTKPGDLIGDIDIDYDLFLKLIEFLKYVVKESLRRDDFL